METLQRETERVLISRRWSHDRELVLVFHCGDTEVRIDLPLAEGQWSRLLDSADATWQGPGSEVPDRIDSDGSVTCRLVPHQVLVFAR